MSKFEKFKNHLREHKKEYLIGGGCLVLGAVGGAILVASGGSYQPTQKVTNILAKGTTVNQTQINVHIEALGDPGNIVQDLDTGTIYASQGQAARELGVNPARLSEHLKGKTDNVNGHRLTKLGKAHVFSNS